VKNQGQLISYTFDDFNNRNSMTVTGSENYTTTYNYNDGSGDYTALLQSESKSTSAATDTTAYTYDNAGSQLTKTAQGKTQEYVYDGLRRLVQVNENNVETASYAYNFTGLRNEKTVDSQTIGLVCVGGQLVVEADVYVATKYIRGAGLIATIDFSYGQFTGDLVYYLHDAHGNVVNLVDGNGEITKTYRYDAFGNEKNPDANDTNPFRYCGEYFDSETGNVYLRARYYDPSNGRFTQRDSYPGRAGDPLSLNLYTYCHNNPVLYIDPTGHSTAKLPDGTTMTINSAWDAAWFYEKSAQMKSGKILDNKQTSANTLAKVQQWNNPTKSSGGTSSKIPTRVTEKQLTEMGFNEKTVSSSRDLNRVLEEYNITSTNEITHFLAQCAHESNLGNWLTEGSYMSYENQMAYLKKQKHYPYYGAGYIQLTWDYNYEAFGESVNDKENVMAGGPEYIVKNYAWDAAGWFWQENSINDKINNGASVKDITKVINGGTNGLSEREAYYKAFSAILN